MILAYALIAGGSKGIGYAIATALARRGYNLILVGRGADSLIVAKNRLEEAFKVKVETLPFDLSEKGTAEAIASYCTDNQIPLQVLCNVAGLGGSKDFLTLPNSDIKSMMEVNLESVVGLTASLIPLLEHNTQSYVLNVASMAGFAPIPVKNVYSATKSAVIFFSYSLRYQLREKNISVSCLCPGPVFTKPEIEEETRNKLGRVGAWMAVDPERVGEIAVRETLRKKLIIVPGLGAKIMSYVLRSLPRGLIVRIYDKLGNKS